MSLGSNEFHQAKERMQFTQLEVPLNPTVERHTANTYAIEFANGGRQAFGDGRPDFILHVRNEEEWNSLIHGDEYTAALAYVKGKVDVDGDVTAAVRFFGQSHKSSVRHLIASAAAFCAPDRLQAWIQSRKQAADNIRFHYDRSNDFYRQFLDSRMIYSCAYFEDEGCSLDAAQLAKMEHISRKLLLQPGDRFLDIGCGWGALVMHAAQCYGAISTGCTLSQEQLQLAEQRVIQFGLADRVSLFEQDYRDLPGIFNKIASVGMVEHVGKHRLFEYFAKIYELLDDDGLMLNHGITRPEPLGEGPESVFIRRNVFPGGELPKISDVLRAAENAGFEVLDVENLRRHYARTCKAWVENLRSNTVQCLKHVDMATLRTWIIFLAGSAVKFEDGDLGLHQTLLCKRGKRRYHPMTRAYMYAPAQRPKARAAHQS